MAEIIEGQIYSFGKERKSINVNGIWLHNFTPLEEDIKKGVDYKITYTIKKSNNKEFNNISNIVPIKKIPVIESKSTKEFIREIGDTSKNCILMQSVIIYLTNKDVPLKEIVKMVTESYKLI